MDFPPRLRENSPGKTADAIIRECRRVRREGVISDEDRLLAAWARGYTASAKTCPICRQPSYDSHVVAARHVAYRLLHEEELRGGTKFRVYACTRGELHIGR